MRLIVIGCAKSKKNYQCKAIEMYSNSTLFQKCVQYALRMESISHNVMSVIFSAKYGLISLNTKIEPYDETIMKHNIKAIYNEITENLSFLNYFSNLTSIELLCSKPYAQIIKSIVPIYIKVYEPLKSYGIGQKLQKLDSILKKWAYEVNFAGPDINKIQVENENST